MAYTLEDFCADCRDSIKNKPGEAGREAIRQNLEKLLANEAFRAEHCGPDAETGIHTLYHDPETDIHVLAHIYAEGRTSPPHDHGASWAVYGQAVEWTDMTIWDRKDDGSKDGYAEVAPAEKYRLEVGQVGKFEPGQIHSIHFPTGARFIRVTGTDLNSIPTHRFDAEKKTVLTSEGSAAGGASVAGGTYK